MNMPYHVIVGKEVNQEERALVDFIILMALKETDLCALSKGHCVDLIAERLQIAGFDDAVVEWGGIQIEYSQDKRRHF
jgi:thiamine biosynthesis lipoprotein ApbE